MRIFIANAMNRAKPTERVGEGQKKPTAVGVGGGIV